MSKKNSIDSLTIQLDLTVITIGIRQIYKVLYKFTKSEYHLTGLFPNSCFLLNEVSPEL